MGVTGISNSSSYDEWMQIQAQKDKEQKNTSEAAAAEKATESAQVASVENTPDSLTESEKVLNITNTDTVEISSEGRAYQQAIQSAGSEPAKAPLSSSASETEESYTNLSSLTEDEIKDLVDKGTITQAEANAELTRRTAAEQAQKNESQNDSNDYMQDIDEE